jgi:hypothetical protein
MFGFLSLSPFTRDEVPHPKKYFLLHGIALQEGWHNQESNMQDQIAKSIRGRTVPSAVYLMKRDRGKVHMSVSLSGRTAVLLREG